MRASLLSTGLVIACALGACSSDDDGPSPTDVGFAEDADTTDAMADAGIRDTLDPVLDMGVDVGTPDSGEADAAEPDLGFADTGIDGGIDGGVDGGIDLTCDPNFFPNGACGGNPIGTWSFADVCGTSAEVTEFLATCPGSTLVSVTRTVTGTVTFDANMAYTLELEDRQLGTVIVGTFCVIAANGCEAVGVLLTDNGVPTTCMTVGANCECDVDLAQPTTESGSYSLLGNQLGLQPGGEVMRTVDYCISGGALRYRAVDDTSTFVLGP